EALEAGKNCHLVMRLFRSGYQYARYNNFLVSPFGIVLYVWILFQDFIYDSTYKAPIDTGLKSCKTEPMTWKRPVISWRRIYLRICTTPWSVFFLQEVFPKLLPDDRGLCSFEINTMFIHFERPQAWSNFPFLQVSLLTLPHPAMPCMPAFRGIHVIDLHRIASLTSALWFDMRELVSTSSCSFVAADIGTGASSTDQSPMQLRGWIGLIPVGLENAVVSIHTRAIGRGSNLIIQRGSWVTVQAELLMDSRVLLTPSIQ
ncbi:hypothetical protein Hypma_003069, partial [Hypsizygus marmoreus]